MDCTGYSFRQLRLYAGHTTPQDTAAYCGVSVSTIRRWDKGRAPPVAIKLYRLLNQDLGVYDPQWRGFRFIDGELVGPDGDHAHAGHIRARRYLEAALAESERRRTREQVPLCDRVRQHLKPLRFWLLGASPVFARCRAIMRRLRHWKKSVGHL